MSEHRAFLQSVLHVAENHNAGMRMFILMEERNSVVNPDRDADPSFLSCKPFHISLIKDTFLPSYGYVPGFVPHGLLLLSTLCATSLELFTQVEPCCSPRLPLQLAESLSDMVTFLISLPHDVKCVRLPFCFSRLHALSIIFCKVSSLLQALHCLLLQTFHNTLACLQRLIPGL